MSQINLTSIRVSGVIAVSVYSQRRSAGLDIQCYRPLSMALGESRVSRGGVLARHLESVSLVSVSSRSQRSQSAGRTAKT